MRPYPAYKDSGVEWMGEVPEGWEVKRLRRVVALNPSKAESNWLDAEAEVSFIPMEAVGENGEIDLSRTRPVGEVENGYTYFRNGDMTFAKITPCFENGKRALMRDLKGGIGFGTTELTVLRAEPSQTTPEFLFWLLSTPEFRKTGEAHMYGAGGQKRVPDDFVREFAAPLPPLPEQQAIARFLDKEVAKIDALVAEQRRLIALLAEKRQVVISHAVTKGLNPATPLKPSGIDWLGDIPEGWEVVPLKYLGNFGAGAGFPHDQQGLEGEELPFFKVNALGKAGPDGVLIPDTDTISCETADRLRATIFPCGTIVFAKIGAALLLGRIRTLPCAACIDNNMMALTVSGDHCTAFVKLAMSTLHFDLISNPGTVPSLNEGQIADQRIALPPMTEQIAIVEYISQTTAQLDALTTAATSAISLLQERRAALISAAVTGKIDLRPHFAQSLSEPELA